jgi:hypothetical protein
MHDISHLVGRIQFPPMACYGTFWAQKGASGSPIESASKHYSNHKPANRRFGSRRHSAGWMNVGAARFVRSVCGVSGVLRSFF